MLCITSLGDEDDEVDEEAEVVDNEVDRSSATAAAAGRGPTRTKRCRMGIDDKPEVVTCCSIASDDAHAGVCSPNAVTRNAVAV